MRIGACYMILLWSHFATVVYTDGIQSFQMCTMSKSMYRLAPRTHVCETCKCCIYDNLFDHSVRFQCTCIKVRLHRVWTMPLLDDVVGRHASADGVIQLHSLASGCQMALMISGARC
jgi:hypothetical protein